MSGDETGLKRYLSRLRREKINLYIVKNGEVIFSSSESGITPIIEVVEKLGIPKLSGSIVIDKIVGKAVALVVSYFEARKVFTSLISQSAIDILNRNNVLYESERLTNEIKAKDGLNVCPFENAVKDVKDPKEGYERLKRLIETMRSSEP